MAISMGGGGDDAPLSDINTTPLVDVMLVLLIIFLIAVPVVIQTVDLELPKVRFEPTTTKPENIALSVNASSDGKCQIFWNVAPISSQDLLKRGAEKLKAVVDRLGSNITADDIPEVHIRGDVNTPYRCIGAVIYTMQTAGFVKVGFISEPEPGVQAAQ